MESVCIQQNTHHHLLNSRSEYNRCSLPRLSTKLGDSDFKKYEKELEEAKKKEEGLEARIRSMRKMRNKIRKPRVTLDPPAKRRKTGEKESKVVMTNWDLGEIDGGETPEDEHHGKGEKRKETAEPPAPKRLKLKNGDIRSFTMNKDVPADKAEHQSMPAVETEHVCQDDSGPDNGPGMTKKATNVNKLSVREGSVNRLTVREGGVNMLAVREGCVNKLTVREGCMNKLAVREGSVNKLTVREDCK